MVFELFRSKGERPADTIESQIAEMLSTASATFEMATDALFRRVEPDEIGKQLRKGDKSINRAERAIRRELVVHAGVRGGSADTPTLLAYMAISKDIERVGDLTKDMWDLGVAGLDLSAEVDGEQLQSDVARVADLIVRTNSIFGDRDAASAATVLNENDAYKDDLEERMLTELGSSSGGAGRALFYRYLQRIVAHLMNVMTSVVMPLDRIDYWDEDKADRLE